MFGRRAKSGTLCRIFWKDQPNCNCIQRCYACGRLLIKPSENTFRWKILVWVIGHTTLWSYQAPTRLASISCKHFLQAFPFAFLKVTCHLLDFPKRDLSIPTTPFSAVYLLFDFILVFAVNADEELEQLQHGRQQIELSF